MKKDNIKSRLVLVRHGESIWNKNGVWTGWADIELSKKGKKEAERAGKSIKNIPFDTIFSSNLKRAIETMNIIRKSFKQSDIPIIIEKSLIERNYGDYTGKNKWEIKKTVGNEEFVKLRRGWNEPLANGETLKQVYDRVVKYFKENIQNLLQNGKNVLIVAHGNTFRVLIKFLENLPDGDLSKIEFATGEVLCYLFDDKLSIIDKKKLVINKNIGKQ